MASGGRLLSSQEQAALMYVHAALPEMDRDTCIDILEGVEWDPEVAVLMLGGSENIPKKYGGDENWPKPSEVRDVGSKRGISTQRSSSGEFKPASKGAKDYSLKYCTSNPALSTKDSVIRPRHNSVPSSKSNGAVPLDKVACDSTAQKVPVRHNLFEAIDGEDWISLTLDSSFVQTVNNLYADPEFDDEKKTSVEIRIPPAMAFELYKYVYFNEEYHRNVESTDAYDDHDGEDSSDGYSNLSSSPEPPSSLSALNLPKQTDGGWIKVGSNSKSVGTRRSVNTDPGIIFQYNSTSRQVTCQNSVTANTSSARHFGIASALDDGGADVQLTYHDYRELAYFHHNKRNQLKEQLFSVRRRQCGSGAIADHYRHEMQHQQSLMRSANDRAKSLILSGTNIGVEATVDLHELFVQEALQVVQKFVQGWKQRLRLTGGEVRLKIITGQGNNSFGQRAKIRPVIINHLASQHISHVVLDGMLLVTLKSPNYQHKKR